MDKTRSPSLEILNVPKLSKKQGTEKVRTFICHIDDISYILQASSICPSSMTTSEPEFAAMVTPMKPKISMNAVKLPSSEKKVELISEEKTRVIHAVNMLKLIASVFLLITHYQSSSTSHDQARDGQGSSASAGSSSAASLTPSLVPSEDMTAASEEVCTYLSNLQTYINSFI